MIDDSWHLLNNYYQPDSGHRKSSFSGLLLFPVLCLFSPLTISDNPFSHLAITHLDSQCKSKSQEHLARCLPNIGAPLQLSLVCRHPDFVGSVCLTGCSRPYNAAFRPNFLTHMAWVWLAYSGDFCGQYSPWLHSRKSVNTRMKGHMDCLLDCPSVCLPCL